MRSLRSSSLLRLASTIFCRRFISSALRSSSAVTSRSRSSARDICSSTPTGGTYVGSNATTRFLGTRSRARICLIRSARRSSSARRSAAITSACLSISSRVSAAAASLACRSSSTASAGRSRCEWTSATTASCACRRAAVSLSRRTVPWLAAALAAMATALLSLACRNLDSRAASSATSASTRRRSIRARSASSSTLRIRSRHSSNSDESRSSASYARSLAASCSCFFRYKLSSRSTAAELSRTFPAPGLGFGGNTTGRFFLSKSQAACRAASTSCFTFSRLVGRSSILSLKGWATGSAYFACCCSRFCRLSLSSSTRSRSLVEPR
mmetsp:Transcript_33684/g.107369  ORF Transcript_33684/g.107369 Transcript_33684/m.107369 type:complete len:326 (-) Transcript_33684:758-1735(-)